MRNIMPHIHTADNTVKTVMVQKNNLRLPFGTVTGYPGRDVQGGILPSC